MFGRIIGMALCFVETLHATSFLIGDVTCYVSTFFRTGLSFFQWLFLKFYIALMYLKPIINMRNLLFFITIFSLFSCNNAGKKEEMVLLDYSTNSIDYNGFDILKSIEKYCYKNPSDQYAKKTLIKAYEVEKKYQQFCYLADSVNDIELIRKEITEFYLQNHSLFRKRNSIDISKLSSKEFLKIAAALMFCNAVKELNKNLSSPDCVVY